MERDHAHRIVGTERGLMGGDIALSPRRARHMFILPTGVWAALLVNHCAALHLALQLTAR
jgi:hypothetical protein